MAWGVSEKKADVKKSSGTKIVEFGGPEEATGEAAMEKKTRAGRNLAGGLEMLDLDFLLGVVENTDGTDKNDVAMRKLGFNEVLRRNQQNEIDSGSLSVYAIDEKNLYGKDIQCEAMKELANRTSHKG